MKTRKFVILSAVALTIAMTGCSAGNKSANQESSQSGALDLCFEEITASQWMKSDSTDGVPSMMMNMKVAALLPSKIGNANVSQLRDSLISMVGMTDFKDGKGVIAPLDSIWKPAAEGTYNSEFYSSNTLTVASVTPRLVVFRNDWNNFTGGNHGMYGTQYLNFSIENSKVLALADIFKPGSDAALQKLLDNMVPSYITKETSPSSLPIPTNFLIEESGMTFFYAPYEIAPYSDGIVAVKLYLNDIRPYLQPGAEKLFTPFSE